MKNLDLGEYSVIKKLEIGQQLQVRDLSCMSALIQYSPLEDRKQ